MHGNVLKTTVKSLPRNVWAVSLTSFLTDISSEMIINVIPLFLSNVLGVKTNLIGLIEGLAEATASLLKVFSGWISDRIGDRKWLAVAGYAISTLSKPFFYIANSWVTILLVRFADRIGKGIRTAPRDALVADSISANQRGLAFGFHRAADTGGAILGLTIAFSLIYTSQSNALHLEKSTFQFLVLVSLVPAALAVLVLAIGAQNISVVSAQKKPQVSLKGLGKPFLIFMVIVGIFDLGNSSDAFLVLRAQERGLDVLSIMGMLITFNIIYTVLLTPAGSLSDRVGRKKIIVIGWLIYAMIYFGFAIAGTGWHIWFLYALYGGYYGLAFGTTKAMVADLVPVELRGTAFGTYNATLGVLDFPASVIAGVLWQGVGSWQGFGAAAPFYFGAVLSLLAAILLAFWKSGTDILTA